MLAGGTHVEHALAATANASSDPATESAVEFRNVTFGFDDHVVLRDVSFTLPKGGMSVLLGASGTGKSVILKLIIGLLRPDAGTIITNGQRLDDLSEAELLRLRVDTGLVFQENALFDSLTVEENVGYRLYEESDMPLDQARARVVEVLGFVGLGDFIHRMPSALSGGQRRRVGIARAMASKPGLLLFDDPTTGLDPIIAATVDDEIVKLRDLEGVTSLLVTHQIRDAFYIADHRAVRGSDGKVQIEEREAGAPNSVQFMVLHDKRIYFQGSAEALLAADDPYLKEYMFMTLPPW
jgi:phospholipid/cholesterol/gamma-HCH transport system ATP-binding protein